MPSDIKTSAVAADEIRLRAYRTQLKNRHEAEVQEQHEKHEDEMMRLSENFNHQRSMLQGAYDVSISREAEQMEDKLSQIRDGYAAKLENEKKAYEKELAKLKGANEARLEEYRKEAEVKLQRLHHEHQMASEALHTQMKKTAKREKGVSET
jgi:hypothetical protein